MLIALSGSAGTGKTTLGRVLAEALGVPFVEEGMRRRLEAGLDVHALTDAERRALHDELLDEHEAAAGRALAERGGCVTDRSPVDFLAFWLLYRFSSDEAATARLARRVEVAARRLDALIILPWGVLPMEEDGIRTPNPWLQLHFQALLEGLAGRHLAPGALWRLPEGRRTLAERLDWVLARMEATGKRVGRTC